MEDQKQSENTRPFEERLRGCFNGDVQAEAKNYLVRMLRK